MTDALTNWIRCDTHRQVESAHNFSKPTFCKHATFICFNSYSTPCSRSPTLFTRLPSWLSLPSPLCLQAARTPTHLKGVQLDATMLRARSSLAALSIANLSVQASTHQTAPTSASYAAKVSTPMIPRPRLVSSAPREQLLVEKVPRRASPVLLASTNHSTGSSLACSAVPFDTMDPEAMLSSSMKTVPRSIALWSGWKSLLRLPALRLPRCPLQVHLCHRRDYPA